MDLFYRSPERLLQPLPQPPRPVELAAEHGEPAEDQDEPGTGHQREAQNGAHDQEHDADHDAARPDSMTEHRSAGAAREKAHASIIATAPRWSTRAAVAGAVDVPSLGVAAHDPPPR